MTADDFREIVLSMDGAAEGAHMKHPDFRANGRVFASLTPGEETAVVKLAPEEQQELMRINPKSFVPAAGAARLSRHHFAATATSSKEVASD